MKSIISGETANFEFVISGIGTPTIVNIVDEIGEVIISGIPVTDNTASFTFDESFKNGLYKIRWEPLTYVSSGIEDLFIFNNNHTILGTSVFKKRYSYYEYPLAQQMVYYSGYQPNIAPFVTHWLVNIEPIYSGYRNHLDAILNENPNIKLGALLPTDSNNVENNYLFPFISGIDNNDIKWTYIWDHYIRKTDLDFYVLSGIETEDFGSWSKSKEKQIIVFSSSPKFSYPALIYNCSEINEASKIMASGIYLFTDVYNIAGREACGLFNNFNITGNFLYRDQNETVYQNIRFITMSGTIITQ